MATKGYEHVQGNFYIILDPFGFEEAYSHWLNENHKGVLPAVQPLLHEPYDTPCHLEIKREKIDDVVTDVIDFPEDIPGSALFV